MRKYFLSGLLFLLVLGSVGSMACTALLNRTETAAPALEDEPEMTPQSAPSAVRTAIHKKYFEICEAELGPFPKETIHCPDAVLIPTERTQSDGTVVEINNGNLPESIPRFRDEEIGQLVLNEATRFWNNITTCDKPSGIFRDMRNAGCVPGSRIKHLTNKTTGGQTVDWVYICRKSSNFPGQEDRYNELGLIGYNRDTGKTCFFAGQPTQLLKIKGQWQVYREIRTEADVPLIEGQHIPAPSFSKFDPKMVTHWSLPAGRGCAGCHSNGPFLRYPFNEPFCLVELKSDNCLKTFSNQKACTTLRDETYKGSDRMKYECRVLKPKRQPGMLYSVVSPFDETGELHKFLSALSAAEKEDSFYKQLTSEKWIIPQRLVSPGAEPCMQCHHIGNDFYAEGAVNSMFSVHRLEGGKFQPPENENWRTRLFLSNVSATQRSDSAHDAKIKELGILPIKVKASSIDQENRLRREQSLGRYQKALKTINDCSLEPADCQWDQHWTLDRVKQEPLKYLQERCSYCHRPGMETSILSTKADFKRKDSTGNNVAIRRMMDPTTPMPPGGKLPASVLDVLRDYLEN